MLAGPLEISSFHLRKAEALDRVHFFILRDFFLLIGEFFLDGARFF